jgi:hypothetical protein
MNQDRPTVDVQQQSACAPALRAWVV